MKSLYAFLGVAALALAVPVAAQTTFDASIVQNAKRSTLRSITAQTRTATRALGFGGVGQYAVLPGPRAILRLSSNQPTFIIAAPDNVQPQGLFTVARFELRKNGTREVLIGGGVISFSSGIPADRIIALNVSEAKSQARRPEGTILYELTPVSPLPSGEYALIASGTQQTGNALNSAGPSGTFYDFGVD